MSNLSKKVFKPDPQLLVLVRNFVFTFLQLGKQNRLTDKQTIYENKLHTDIWLRIVNKDKIKGALTNWVKCTCIFNII